jgi:hypothetical protein
VPRKQAQHMEMTGEQGAAHAEQPHGECDQKMISSP